NVADRIAVIRRAVVGDDVDVVGGPNSVSVRRDVTTPFPQSRTLQYGSLTELDFHGSVCSTRRSTGVGRKGEPRSARGRRIGVGRLIKVERQTNGKIGGSHERNPNVRVIVSVAGVGGI